MDRRWKHLAFCDAGKNDAQGWEARRRRSPPRPFSPRRRSRDAPRVQATAPTATDAPRPRSTQPKVSSAFVAFTARPRSTERPSRSPRGRFCRPVASPRRDPDTPAAANASPGRVSFVAHPIPDSSVRRVSLAPRSARTPRAVLLAAPKRSASRRGAMSDDPALAFNEEGRLAGGPRVQDAIMATPTSAPRCRRQGSSRRSRRRHRASGVPQEAVRAGALLEQSANDKMNSSDILRVLGRAA